jgi:hypothetical protein
MSEILPRLDFQGISRIRKPSGLFTMAAPDALFSKTWDGEEFIGFSLQIEASGRLAPRQGPSYIPANPRISAGNRDC